MLSQDLNHRTYYRNAGECATILKAIPGCKSAGYKFNSAQCFFSTSVISRSGVREQGNDDVDVDWYAVDKCFTCSECESGSVETSAPAIASNTQVPEQATTTKSAESTETACLPTKSAQRGDWSDHDDWNCQIYGGYQGDFYEFYGQGKWTGEATQPEQCMAMCKATPGCKSAAMSYSWRKCYGSNNVLTQGETREASNDSIDKEWWGLKCVNCVDNECKSGAGGKTTLQAPERTTFATRTSAPATTTTGPPGTCIYELG
ncbi:uncharacterized protein FTOL_13405 [Fusarium torulosum]|uniref:Apple domain-containing protein n=1 Tax=Fusarium torulosum TaxID=33205 RepID=A0AAE8MMG4_9HYPO|nr:uncharacterized protein FTOL_13405 [Fusarium torulosum]